MNLSLIHVANYREQDASLNLSLIDVANYRLEYKAERYNPTQKQTTGKHSKDKTRHGPRDAH